MSFVHSLSHELGNHFYIPGNSLFTITIYLSSHMNFFNKARSAGITPQNILSWFSLEFMRVAGLMTGTMILYLKAGILGVEIGKGVRAHGPVGLLRWPRGRIRIGNNVSIISSWRRATAAPLAWPTRLRVFGKGAFIDIGDGCQLNGTSITARSTSIALGRQVLVGPNCVIVDSDFHALWPPDKRAVEPGMCGDRPVTIGDFAWIGMGSLILKGVDIGTGAIIGAGSVVCKNIPANCLAVGIPARVVRELDR